MRKFGLAFGASLVFVSMSASAHFNLKSPPTPAGSVDGKGNPPCGPDTTDGVVTEAMGGSMLPLSIQETVRHGGFYRVALALKSCKTDGCFPADNKVYDAQNMALAPTGPGTSDHADFEANPTFPILGDNLFPHEQAGSPESYTGMVQLPNVTCDKCTLQVIEFMAPHGPNGAAGYFYHHCADLKITADPGKPIFDPNGTGGSGAGGGGGAAAGGGGAGGTASGGTATAGAGGSAVGTGGTGAATGGTSAGSSGGPVASAGTATAGGTAPAAGGSGAPTSSATSSDSGGCGLARQTHGGASLVAAAGLLFALGRRRRAR